MRALIDTDVILDVLLERQPFLQNSRAVWPAHEDGQFDGYVAAITPVNVFYIARRYRDAATTRQLLGDLLATFSVCSLDHAILQTAYAFPMADFEDGVQHASAAASQLDAIITRNVGDYAQATLPVFTPTDFLAHLAQQNTHDNDASN
jgi:predicted nucleic acid-binding protein